MDLVGIRHGAPLFYRFLLFSSFSFHGRVLFPPSGGINTFVNINATDRHLAAHQKRQDGFIKCYKFYNLKSVLVACMFQNNSEFSESEHDLYSSKVVSKVNIILLTPPRAFQGLFTILVGGLRQTA